MCCQCNLMMIIIQHFKEILWIYICVNEHLKFVSIYFYIFYQTLAWWLECSLMARETWVKSQVESYQGLKKWYLMPLWLTLSIIRYRSRVKWSNPRKGVAPPPTPWCGSYQKGILWVTLDYGRQLYFYLYLPLILVNTWNF